MSRHLLAIVAFLAAPSVVRADQGELYTSVELSPQFSHVSDAVTEASHTTTFTPAASFSVLYGITNTIHVGATVHFMMARNVTYQPITLRLPDSSSSTGALYEDITAYGASLAAAYRFDTGTHLAPIIQADVGLASLAYSNVSHVPSGILYAIAFPSVSELVLEVRASARLEYRFGDHMVASGGAGVILAPGSLTPWTIQLPITVGWIW